MRITVGSTVRSMDGDDVLLTGVVVNPRRYRLTHLIVRLPGRGEGSRLVPVQAITLRPSAMVLQWSMAQVAAAATVEHAGYWHPETWPSAETSGRDIGIIHRMTGPLDPARHDFGSGAGTFDDVPDLGPTMIWYDQVPEGTAELQQVSDVLGQDGHPIAHLRELVVDENYAIIALIVEQRHRLRHHEHVVPIDQVASISTGLVRLRTADLVAIADLAA